MVRIFSCTTPFAIEEIWGNSQISSKSTAYHPIKHSDRLCPGLGGGGHGGGREGGRGRRRHYPCNLLWVRGGRCAFHKHSFSSVRQSCLCTKSQSPRKTWNWNQRGLRRLPGLRAHLGKRRPVSTVRLRENRTPCGLSNIFPRVHPHSTVRYQAPRTNKICYDFVCFKML